MSFRFPFSITSCSQIAVCWIFLLVSSPLSYILLSQSHLSLTYSHLNSQTIKKKHVNIHCNKRVSSYFYSTVRTPNSTEKSPISVTIVHIHIIISIFSPFLRVKTGWSGAMFNSYIRIYINLFPRTYPAFFPVPRSDSCVPARVKENRGESIIS